MAVFVPQVCAIPFQERHDDHEHASANMEQSMNGHTSGAFDYDSVAPFEIPPFCTVEKATIKVNHTDLAHCLALDEVDKPINAAEAGWMLRPSPPINVSNVHAHAHGTEKPMAVFNETRLFLRKGAVPLSYIEWDFATGLGRLSELRRFVSEDAAKVQQMWPKRPVIGASGGYWRTLGDIDYPVAWNTLRDDVKWRLHGGTEEPSRQLGLLVTTVVLFVVACFLLLPLLLCLQASQSSLVPLLSLLYLATYTFSMVLGRMYFALTPDLYPPSALPGLVRTLLVLSFGCFALPAAQLLLLVVPFVRGRLRSWADVHRLLQILARGKAVPEVPLAPASGFSQSTPSTDGTLTENMPESAATGDREDFVMFDQDQDAPLMDSPMMFGAREDDLPLRAALRRPWERLADRHPRLWFTLDMIYTTVSRALVPLAFVVVYVGIAIYTGSCRRGYKNVCLAHGIKGAVFFWYGVLTFARYLGAFGEYGWAWNKRPSLANTQHSHAAYWRRTMPSGEFVECFAIFLYGITNTWLERLGAKPGDPYTVKQIQHISIAVMFWFVGLVGMTLESTRVRSLLGYAVVFGHPSAVAPRGRESEVEAQAPPPSYSSNFNPFPALVIGVTGVAMALHHQDYEYEVEVHILWGIMLAAFAFLRCLTYFLLWLRPPTSVLPSRPPTEAIASFALCCGGLLFMLSNEEVSFAAMRADYADGMAVMNLAVSLVGLVFSWSFCIMVIKAWALRRESGARPLSSVSTWLPTSKATPEAMEMQRPMT
ncbi:hypothetical protein MNAN1_003255 [Malassezia nana]|uniref:Protein YTP1-like C-terminal domain-containing protein n=1 Tax=Malassezia nana TaxID=180528 RepID=A0AAF0EPF5_9BASI|nr:hypothetical protein MNAN1_003255 [Malassezia nana]